MSTILCSFSSGLDDMRRKDQRDVVKVLRVLKQCGRFSVFEATANQSIATMMDRLMHKGCSVVRDGVRTDYGRLLIVDGGNYPWTYVRLTEAGERLLADSAAGVPVFN